MTQRMQAWQVTGPGEPADLTLFSTEHSWTFRAGESASKSRNTPFDGRMFRGGPMATIVAGKIVYRRGTATLKRVLALGGAKNHLIVMPDADVEMTSSNVVASMSGCAGQRCMAASVMVAVADTDHIIQRMLDQGLIVETRERPAPAPRYARTGRS